MNDANNARALLPCKFCGTYPNPNDPSCATLEQAYARTEVRPFGCPYFTDSDRKMYPLSTPNAPVETAIAQVEWLEDAARYFEARPTLGEDMAHWANVHNAEMCRKIAAILAVRLDEAAIRKDEREKCVAIADAFADRGHQHYHAVRISSAIRNGGKQP